ncbi:uncharacterized protein LOC113562581, partial [Ooceraea biroi]|uniref:uncharacterized protein LOC113562581 n=1 Tax=Ooceraea biroi TaxID=2015173 RepID=UPI000F094C2C
YAIMEGRSAENYIDVLDAVVNVIKIKPDTAISDFERAERKALRTVFPSAKIIGSFFHYSQALVHNADKFGILKGDDKELGWGATKLLVSLAFLPKNLIEEGFQIISKIIFKNYKYLDSFFNYYKETWLNGFKSDSFSVFQQLHKTNNISERHNRELRETLRKHSTIVEFLGIYCECPIANILLLFIKCDIYYLQLT